MAGLGSSKPSVLLAGSPMIDWPLRALAAVCPRVAVVCKSGTELPRLPGGAERWNEPDEPRHPLTGIVFALQQAQTDVLVCAADMPFVRPADLRALMSAAQDAPRAGAAVAHAGGRLQPALAVYRHAALGQLGEAVADAPLTRTIEGLEHVRVCLGVEVVRSVDTPAELAAAEMELAGPALRADRPRPAADPGTSTPMKVDAHTFAEAFARMLEHPRAPWLTPYTVEGFAGMTCFFAHGGKVGGALKPTEDGIELVSVFNRGGPPGAGAAMVEYLIGQGAERLNCIGPQLMRIYENAGFEVVERLEWDDRYAPANWNYENGRPNIYVMVIRR